MTETERRKKNESSSGIGSHKYTTSMDGSQVKEGRKRNDKTTSIS